MLNNARYSKLIFVLPFATFLLLFLVGIGLPLYLTPHYGNYMSRIWNWTEILIALTAIYYIIRGKTFNLKQAVISLLLGAVCLTALFRDPRYIDIVITGISTAVCFYGGCRLFEQSGMENRSISIGTAGSMKYFFLGAVISIPLALLNVFLLSLQGQVNIGNILLSAIFALKPAIAEEVIFRYFLFAYACRLLHGKVSERFFTVYVYILMIIPHGLLHLPDMFLQSPINAIFMLVLLSVFFGFPMAFLLKRKNLQMSVGMHWFIDFLRFSFGF